MENMKARALTPYVVTLIAGVMLGFVLAGLHEGQPGGATEQKAVGPVTPSTTPRYTPDNKVVVDLALLESLPARRRAAAAVCEPTDKDSTPAILEKEIKYYETLKSYVTLLRQTYYRHNEFPTNMCEGIEEHAIVLAGIEYPLYHSTGCSAYDSLWIHQRIRMTDDLIVRMARSITEAALGQDVMVARNVQITFAVWKQEWEAQPTNAPYSSPAAGSKR
jgi:hypothetical protein